MRAFVTALIAAVALGAGIGIGFWMQGSEETVAPSFRDQLDAIEVPEAPTGDGVITGVVQGPDGAPLSGVDIEASLFWPGWEKRAEQGVALPADEDLEALVKETVQSELWMRAARRRAKSAADGTFRIEGLSDHRYLLRAYRKGWKFEADDAWNARAGAEVTFRGEPLVRLRVGIEGVAPLAYDLVRIEWSRIEGGSATTSSVQAWTPARPWIELPPGRYSLRAYLRRGQQSGHSEATLVTLRAGEDPEPIRFAVRLAATLVVHVETPPDYVGNSVRVTIQRLGERNETIGVAQSDWGNSPLTFRELKPGKYRVVAGWGAGAGQETTQSVEVTEGIVEARCRLAVPDPAWNFLVRVERPDGSVLTDALFGQYFRGNDGSGHGTARVDCLRLKNGMNIIAPIEKKGMGRFTLVVHHDEYGRLERVAHPAEKTPVVFRFAEPAFVEATVSEYAKAGCRCRVKLVPEKEEPWEWSADYGDEPTLAADGTIRLGPVQPGVYNLVLFLQSQESEGVLGGAWTSSAYLAHDRLALGPGVRTARLGIPKLYTVRVKSAEEKDVSFYLEPMSEEALIKRSRWLGTVGDDGIAEFRFVPAGTYAVLGTKIEVPKQLEATVR